ncbi:hypothetical protein IV102_21525 [bacterium]|nr:hypothetical protein [bacterium]
MCKLKGLAVYMFLGLMLTSIASAVPVVTFTNLNSVTTIVANFTQGWQFTTNSAVTVTDLGFFDGDQDGLLSVHEVGIFNAAGALLISGTVPTGVAAPLINQFRYVAVAPTLLPSGQTFRIGAYYPIGGEQIVITPVGLALDPSITYGGSRFFNGGGALNDPTSVTGSLGRFGPNFNILAAAAGAPELDPRSGGVALASLLLILGVAERRRRGSMVAA